MSVFLVWECMLHYIIPSSLTMDFSTRFLDDLFLLIYKFNLCLDEIKKMLSGNCIWKEYLI